MNISKGKLVVIIAGCLVYPNLWWLTFVVDPAFIVLLGASSLGLMIIGADWITKNWS